MSEEQPLQWEAWCRPVNMEFTFLWIFLFSRTWRMTWVFILYEKKTRPFFTVFIAQTLPFWKIEEVYARGSQCRNELFFFFSDMFCCHLIG